MYNRSMDDKKKHWNRKKLTPEQYKVTAMGGTEAPFSGKYLDTNDSGMYKCLVCGNQLFSSDAKFETKIPGFMGWPSFEDATPGALEFRPDNSSGMNRTEVLCAKCGAHLGHVFDDESETKTGKHYCINSCALEFS